MSAKTCRKVAGIHLERALVSITPFECVSSGLEGCIGCPSFVAVVTGEDGELCVLCRKQEEEK